MSKRGTKSVVFSALEVANICGVVNQTAINWIRSGYLKAFTTPGGQFRVYPDDLAAFMSSRNMLIPEALLKLCKDRSAYALNTLLIIDDDKPLNDVIADYMRKKFPAINIFQAYDGFEAGLLLASKHPQCLILDLDLPGMDGFELCKQIYEGGKFGNPQVLVITALEETGIEERLEKLGVAHFFRKPLVLDSLSKIVERVYRE
ncbi:response regulator [Treponema parvum]|uniref:Response regulator n=1 Tax=Treponema parvum TaxID=138851 RepID=A0A975ICT8_9SPIR|nr:response regulator [Treponema parvum]QTQ12346.1 response regulator [Treponema parvum]